MRSTNNTRNMLGRPNPYRKNRQAGTLDDLMFDMDKRRHTSFRFQNYQNFITDRPGKSDVRYRQKHSWCALDEETGELDYLTEDGPSPSGGRRQSTSSIGSRTTNGDRDSLLALARESSSSGSGAGGGEEKDSMPLNLSGRKDSGILTPPRRSSLTAQGFMSPITPVFEGASTPKPSSGRSWVAPQFSIDPENRTSRVLHECTPARNDDLLLSATPEAEDGPSMVDTRGDALAVLPTVSNVAASASPAGNAITLSPILSNRQLLQAFENSPVHHRTGSSGRRSSTSACSLGTSSMRSAGSWARRSGGGGSNVGSSGSSRVSKSDVLGSGVAADNTVVVQTIKPSSGRGVMEEEGVQGESGGSSTVKAAFIGKDNGEVDTLTGSPDSVEKENPGREPSYGTVSQQTFVSAATSTDPGRGSMLASNGGEDGGGEFPRKSEVSTYFSSIASGTTWSDTTEGSMATLGVMPEATENRGKEVSESRMDEDDSGLAVMSSEDTGLFVGLLRVDDGKLEHDKGRRRGVAGDLEAVIAELSRRKSSLAWEDGEGAYAVEEASPDETGTDEVMELLQNKRSESAAGTLHRPDDVHAAVFPEIAKIDEKHEAALTPEENHVSPPRNEEAPASLSVGPAKDVDTCVSEIPEAIAEKSEDEVGMRETVAEMSGKKAEISKTGAEIFGATAESSETGAEISRATVETSENDSENSRAIAFRTPTGAVPSMPLTRVDHVSVEGRGTQKAAAEVASGDGHPAPRVAVVATAAAAMAAANARSPRVVARARATVAAKKRTNQRASHTTIAFGSKASGGVASTPASRGAVKTPASRGVVKKMVSEGTVKTPLSRAAVKMSTSGGVVRTPGSGAAVKLLSCEEADKLAASKGAVKTKISDEVVKTTALDKATGRVATEATVKQRSHRPRYDAPTASSVARAHGVSGSGGGTGKSTTQHHGRKLGRGREERMMTKGKSHLGRRSLSAPPAGLREELACGIDTMVADFGTPSDVVKSNKERAKDVPPLSGVPSDAHHSNETVDPSLVSGAVPAGARVKRGAVKSQKQKRDDAALNTSEAVVKPVQVSMTDDETPPRPGSMRSGHGGGRSRRRGGSVEAPRSMASHAMPPPPPPPASRGAGAQGTARKGKHQVKDSFNRLKGWIHGGFAGGSDRDNTTHGGVTPSARGSARIAAGEKASKGRRGAPSAAGVSTIEAAKSVVEKTVAGRAGVANPGLEKGGETLDELGHMTVVELVRERGRGMERPLQAASAGLSPSPSPSTSSSVSASPFQLEGEGSTTDKTGVAPRRVKAAAAQGSSTSTLAPSSGRSKTASVARIPGTTVPPLLVAGRTVSNTSGAPVGRFRKPIESTSAGCETRTLVDGLVAGRRGREATATATVGNEAGASGARSQRGKMSTRVRGESTANGGTKRTAAKGSRSRTAGK